MRIIVYVCSFVVMLQAGGAASAVGRSYPSKRYENQAAPRCEVSGDQPFIRGFTDITKFREFLFFERLGPTRPSPGAAFPNRTALQEIPAS